MDARNDSPLPLGSPERKPVRAVKRLPEPLLDSEEAASVINIHPKTLQKLARCGSIRGIHVGKLWRFRSTDLEEWIAKQ